MGFLKGMTNYNTLVTIIRDAFNGCKAKACSPYESSENGLKLEDFG